MKEESRLLFISKDQKKVKEFRISRTKLFTFISIFLIIFLVAGKFGLDMLINFSHNSKIERLERTNIVLQTRLNEMQKTITDINHDMDQIAKKDDQLRTVLGLSKINADIRQVGIGGSQFDYTESDEVSGFDEGRQLGMQLNELSRLSREVNLEYKSYHDLMVTFDKKQDSLKYMPALRPVIKGYISSPFGNRFHPVYHKMRHHDGIDISAPRGTPVYASAEGQVRFAGINGGYGRMVILDHKYGYRTGYGHLQKIFVRKGQIVKRGEKIGEVGNTGISTGPHLHYEVRFNGKPINPRPFFFDDYDLNQMVVHND